MATVYLAEDRKHGREVALKVLRPELAATMGPERFAREIQVAARLQHPHILPLHDSGEADGFLYFVMPYVAGESLRARLDRVGELPIADAVRIATQVVDALAHAHAMGVVHRDIKPDNVLLSGRHALVADFGVAKAVSEATGRHGLTTAGVALGTPMYMAPEQATADPQIDQRVDIYAVGVLLYEMLAGRPPFHGLSAPQLLAAHVTEAPRPLRTLRDACSPALEAVVMRCLAKRPADRYQDAEALLQALEPLGATSGDITPAQTRPMAAVSGATGAAPTPARRGVRVAVLGGLAALLVLAGGWFATRARGGDAGAPEIALSSLERIRVTASGWARSGALSRDANRVAFFERRCDTDNSCTTDLRVQDVGGAGSTVLVSDLDLGIALDWSPDGRWLAFSGTVGGRYGAWLVPTLGGAPRFLGCCSAVFSGQGDTLLLTSPELSGAPPTLSRGTASSGSFPEQLRLNDTLLAGVSFVREVRHDRLVATVMSPNRMDPYPRALLLDRRGTVLDTLPVQGLVGALSLPQRTATGFWLAHVEDERNPSRNVTLRHFRWDARGSVAAMPTAIVRGVPIAGGISITPDGTLMAGDGAAERSVWAAERDAPESMAVRLRRVAQSTAGVTGSITPDGRQLLVSRDRPNNARVRELSVIPFDGGAERRLTELEDADDWDIFPDGRRVLVAQFGELQTRRVLLDLETGTVTAYGEPSQERPTGHEMLAGGGFIYRLGFDSLVVRDVPGRPDTVFAVTSVGGLDRLPSASPDGARAAFVMWQTSLDTLAVLTMDLRTGALTRHADLRGEGSAGHVWLPSGDLLVTVWETDRVQVWWLVPTTGGAPRRLGVAPRSDGTYRFSADGLRAIYRESIMRSDIEIWRGLPADGVPVGRRR